MLFELYSFYRELTQTVLTIQTTFIHQSVYRYFRNKQSTVWKIWY